MALKQRQSTRTTTSARQKLLQVNRIMLDQMISSSNEDVRAKVMKELMDNFMLEEKEEEEQPSKTPDKKLYTPYGPIVLSSSGCRLDVPDFSHSESTETLADVLTNQVEMGKYPKSLLPYLNYIIDNIDSNGYFYLNLDVVAEGYVLRENNSVSLAVVKEKLRRALEEIRKMEPAGVGAVSLFDCICLQLERRRELPECDLAIDILQHKGNLYKELNLSGKSGTLRKLSDSMGVPEDRVVEAIKTIKKCSPKPGAMYGSRAPESIDFQVDIDLNGELILSSTLSRIPTVVVRNDEDIKTTMRSLGYSKEANDLMKQHYLNAKQFVSIVENRNLTLLNIVQLIVLRQKDFLISGDRSQLHPLKLEDIAEEIGVGVSTVSRATNGRFIQTIDGLLPLKMFFVSSVNGQSRNEVLDCLANLVENEDKDNPYNDEQLSELLKDNHFNVERRTIVKYRKQLGIPPMRRRRMLARIEHEKDE